MTTYIRYDDSQAPLLSQQAPAPSIEPPGGLGPSLPPPLGLPLSFRHCSYAKIHYPEMVTSFCLIPVRGLEVYCAEHAIPSEAGA